MNFRKSQMEDVDRILELIEMAKSSLKEMGIDQWQNGYPNREKIENDVNKGISYVLEIEKSITENTDFDKNNNKKIVATIVLSPEPETAYDNIDGSWKTTEPYVAIHRVAVDNSVKNQGIATKVLSYSENFCRENGIENLRADTHTENIPMQRVLIKQGFEIRGEITLDREPDVGAKRIAFDKIVKK